MSYTPKQMVLLSSQAASASASVSFTSSISSVYSTYILKIKNMVPATNNVAIHLLFSTDNGATYLNSNYSWTYSTSYVSGLFGSGSASDSKILLGDSLSNVSTQPCNGDITFYNLNTSNTASCLSRLVYYNAPNPGIAEYFDSGFNSTTTPVNALRIILSSGNIASGNFYLYGVVEP